MYSNSRFKGGLYSDGFMMSKVGQMMNDTWETPGNEAVLIIPSMSLLQKVGFQGETKKEEMRERCAGALMLAFRGAKH